MEVFPRRNPLLLVILMAALNMASCRYHDDSPASQPNPSILVHKQALNDDGSFNFVFAADNGLRQGERILPDGTRVGAYSYVDPNGETISVKYKAGKDGFKILEGAHIPTAPPSVADDPADADTDIVLPTTTRRPTYTTPQPPKPRERLRKEAPQPRRPTLKVPVAPKKIRIRGAKHKVPLVMMHRNPNESEQRVASFHVEQPTYRGLVNKADVDSDQPGRESKQDPFSNKEYPKAYSFQFGSA